MKNNFIILSVLIIKFIFDFLYISQIAEIFAYMGFFNRYNLLNYFLGLITIIIIFFIIDKNSLNPTNFLLNCIYFFLIIPGSTYLAFHPDFLFAYILIIYSFIFILVSHKLIPHIIIKVSFNKFIKKYFITILKYSFYISLLLIIIFAYIQFLQIEGISLNDVTQNRSNFNSSYFPLFNYFTSNFNKVIIPIILCFLFLYKKNWKLFFFIIFSSFYLWLIGQKSLIFYNFFILFFIFFTLRKNSLTSIFIYFTIFCTLTGLFFDFILDQILFISFIIRRFYFISLQNIDIYIQFFQNNPFVYWSNNIFSIFLDYPYHDSVPNIIGRYKEADQYSHLLSTANINYSHSNSGFIASGYSNFGFIGLNIYLLILSIILKTVSIYFEQNNKNMILLISSFIPLISIVMSSDLLVSMLTHGFLFFIFLIYLFKGYDERN